MAGEWIERARELGCVVVVPTYNNSATLSAVIDDVLMYCADVIVVDDGSTDATAQLLAAREDVAVLSYGRNRGKGHALKIGLREAFKRGFRYAITIDSDGQHYASDIPHFLEHIAANPGTLIIGARNLTAENMPGKNTFANRFSNFWFRVETWKTLSDTQSGFRLYPLAAIGSMRFVTPRYEFEVEIIVRAAWRGVAVENIPIRVFYPEKEERVSHFRPLRDFTRISILNTFLVLIALFYYYPKVFFRSLNRKNIKAFFRKHIIESKESNPKIALSVGFGVFCGIIPLWGYQMITAGVLAHVMRLNKVISVASSNISLPPLMPFILLGSLFTGGLILGRPVSMSLSAISFETLSTSLLQYIVGSVVLAIIAGAVIGAATYLILRITRKEPRHE